jgi:RimJ/RimL family protein N-acetyltransferase
MIIEDRNFKLKDFTKEDITSDYLGWINNKNLLRYSKNKKIIDYRSAYHYLKSHNKKNNLFLSILSIKEKKMIGTFTIYLDEKNKTANLGILIGEKRARGKGMGYKIYKLVISFLFKKKRIQKIIVGTRKDNAPMINICKKLKMKFFFEEKKNENIIQNFYLKKNFSDETVGVFLGDYGAKNLILAYLKNKKNLKINSIDKYKMCLKKFKSLKIYNDLKKLVFASDYVLIGTGNNIFEKKILQYMCQHKAISCSVIDHYTSILERYEYKKKIYLTNEIWVFEKMIYDKLPENFTSKKKLKRNYYFYHLKKSSLKKNKKYITYFTEPFRKPVGKKYRLDYYSMKYFLEKVKNIRKFSNYKIQLKLHPKDNESYIKKILFKEIENVNATITNKKLEKVISETKYAFGLTTMALIITSKLKIPTYHCKLPKQKISLINSYPIKSFYQKSLDIN